MFGYARSVQHLPLPPNPTKQKMVISWQISSSKTFGCRSDDMITKSIMDCDLGSPGAMCSDKDPNSWTWCSLWPSLTYSKSRVEESPSPLHRKLFPEPELHVEVSLIIFSPYLPTSHTSSDSFPTRRQSSTYHKPDSGTQGLVEPGTMATARSTPVILSQAGYTGLFFFLKLCLDFSVRFWIQRWMSYYYSHMLVCKAKLYEAQGGASHCWTPWRLFVDGYLLMFFKNCYLVKFGRG